MYKFYFDYIIVKNFWLQKTTFLSSIFLQICNKKITLRRFLKVITIFSYFSYILKNWSTYWIISNPKYLQYSYINQIEDKTSTKVAILLNIVNLYLKETALTIAAINIIGNGIK